MQNTPIENYGKDSQSIGKGSITFARANLLIRLIGFDLESVRRLNLIQNTLSGTLQSRREGILQSLNDPGFLD